MRNEKKPPEPYEPPMLEKVGRFTKDTLGRPGPWHDYRPRAWRW
ncbi:lasso RiPP family leader peptide-containing protein [Streptomyces smyrnaeus]|uniref:Lasso RiPP family leader peptide-containing protein n=1 Tax=Streptomyces smyrnaeus TaxID=1387713 RepID=A0ABS3XZF6_9ACTN|nr:lasso RiPP family leader peptide-containing protein [Streptomyces smyrnaeus]MBO8200764.1 lasso RiPP family leader peptide-containing protein [Streptomyces smyrnaeus]